jgi:hypothetical protein
VPAKHCWTRTNRCGQTLSNMDWTMAASLACCWPIPPSMECGDSLKTVAGPWMPFWLTVNFILILSLLNFSNFYCLAPYGIRERGQKLGADSWKHKREATSKDVAAEDREECNGKEGAEETRKLVQRICHQILSLFHNKSQQWASP